MTALYFLCFFQVFLLFVVLNIGDKDILKPSSVIVVVFTISTTIALLYHKKWTAISNYSWFSAFLIASGNCTFIIVDARLKNEFESIKNKYEDVISIKLERKNYDDMLTVSEAQHITENEIDAYNGFDYLIENNNLNDLKTKALEIVRKEESDRGE